MRLGPIRFFAIVIVSLFCLLYWTGSPLAMEPAPPQVLTDGHLFEANPANKMRDGQESKESPKTTRDLGAQRYLVIDATPVDGNTHSRGYGINNSSQILGRTYSKDASSNTEDLRALFWELPGNSQSLETLSGASGGWGINDAGMACGFSTNSDGYERAVRWDLGDGSMIDLGVLTNPTTGESGNESYSYMGINDAQKVVGHSEIPNDYGSFTPYHAFLYDETNGIQDLGTLYGTSDDYYMGGYSIAYDINNNDIIVGISHDANWYFRPFIWQDNEMAALNIDTDRESGEWYATVINDNGVIGGYVIVDDVYYIYYWPSASDDPISIALPEDYPNGEIYGINNNGQMVGGIFNDDADHAFIFDSTNGLVDLNGRIDVSDTWELQTAIDINDLGQITGIGIIDGNTHGFLLTPITDVDSDGDVDGSDLARLAHDMEDNCTTDCDADFNGDDSVDAMDIRLLSLVLGNEG